MNLELMRRIDGQLWCADITYVRMQRGLLSLAAIMDWHSRAVLSWRLSNTLDVDFCVAALEEAMNRHGVPEIINSEQGSQFNQTGIHPGTQGCRRGHFQGWQRSVDGQRHYRTPMAFGEMGVVYLRELETGSQARQALEDWFRFYNEQRPHTAFDGRRPMDVYREGHSASKAA